MDYVPHFPGEVRAGGALGVLLVGQRVVPGWWEAGQSCRVAWSIRCWSGCYHSHWVPHGQPSCPRRTPALHLLTLLQKKAAEGGGTGGSAVKRSLLEPNEKLMVDMCKTLGVS